MPPLVLGSLKRVLVALVLSPLVLAQERPALTSDVPKEFHAPVDTYDYIRRVEMIPMRDGVKLYTVIVVPKGAKNAPILLTRTPYNASKRTARNNSPHMLADAPARRRGVRRRRLHPRVPGRPRQVQIGRRLPDDAARARAR